MIEKKEYQNNSPTDIVALVSISITMIYFSISYLLNAKLMIDSETNAMIIIISGFLGILSFIVTLLLLFKRTKITYILTLLWAIITLFFRYFVLSLGYLFGITLPVIIILLLLINKHLFGFA